MKAHRRLSSHEFSKRLHGNTRDESTARKTNLHIIFVAPHTPDKGSAGIEQYIHHLSEYFSAKGNRVEIWGTDSNYSEKKSGNVLWKSFTGWSPRSAFYFSPALYNALCQSDADIVHANGFNNLTTIAAALAKKPHQKLVVTMNSSPPSSPVTKVLRTPYEWLFRALAPRFDKIICVSKNEYSIFTNMLGLPHDRFAVIPNGFDRTAFQKMAVKKKPNQILLIGRMVPNKGHMRVINALPLLKKTHPKVELHIVGSGPLENELKTNVQRMGLDSSVIFHGSIPVQERSRVIRLLKESALLVLLSDYEGNPLVLGEGLAAGIPLVVSDKGVMHEYVERKDAVGIVDINNPHKVASVLSRVLTSPSSFVGKRIPESWDDVGKAVEKIYHNLIQYSTK
jgi:glycosyltransferase involved in cell wall biosynthesis